MDTVIIYLAVILGLYMAWNIGANDVANSMANAVGSKSISIRNAVIAAGICEFAGAVLVGAQVTETIRKGIVDPAVLANLPGITPHDAAVILVIGMSAVLLSSAFWLNFSTCFGMPVSTTHTVVGAVAGFGVVAAGWHAVSWGKMGQIVSSWFISPVVGGIFSFITFIYIRRAILGSDKPARAAIKHIPFIAFILTALVLLATIYKGLKHVIRNIDWLSGNRAMWISLGLAFMAAILYYVYARHMLRGRENEKLGVQLEAVEKVFVPLIVVSSCSVAFAHGANDVANAIGPLAAIFNILETGIIDSTVPVPLWILVLGGTGIVVGLATYGVRVMMTVGTNITEITPSRGVAANIAATATVLACTRLALPVSTTHTLVGAILGIGFARGLGSINKKVVCSIFGSWIFTVPAAAIMSGVLYVIGKIFFFDTISRVIGA
jgi:PiT family inorganic phosphate transporter